MYKAHVVCQFGHLRRLRGRRGVHRGGVGRAGRAQVTRRIHDLGAVAQHLCVGQCAGVHVAPSLARYAGRAQQGRAVIDAQSVGRAQVGIQGAAK